MLSQCLILSTSFPIGIDQFEGESAVVCRSLSYSWLDSSPLPSTIRLSAAGLGTEDPLKL